jgi:putative membrane protein
VSFGTGWLMLTIALVSPVAWLSEILFSVHMTQHMLLMLVAAPLLAFGQPFLAYLWIFGPVQRERVGSALRNEAVVATWRWLTAPLTVFVLQAVALWIWHVPSLYESALRSDALHALQHLSFVLTAATFWWALVYGRYGRQGYGLSVLYVFLTAVHSGALGALLTVSPSPWYRWYARPAEVWRIDALGDQQLAGILMWIPAGAVFIVLGLALFAAWMGEAERRVRLSICDDAARSAHLEDSGCPP